VAAWSMVDKPDWTVRGCAADSDPSRLAADQPFPWRKSSGQGLQAACATAGRGRTGLDLAHSFGLESTGLVQLKQVFPVIWQPSCK
jgi:hypothetical protein